MSEVPPAYAAFVDAVLRALDPRLDEDARHEAILQASAEPEFVIGQLCEILAQYHERAERLAGLRAGTFVDRLRARAFGDLTPDDVLGYAIGAGSMTPFRHPDVPVDASPAPPSIAEVAAREEAKRRQRLQGIVAGEDPGPPDDEPRTVDMLGELAAKAPGNPQLAALLGEISGRRAEQRSQRSMSDGGHDPAPVTLCGHMTRSGPCVLRAEHPAAPGFPGEDGHMSEEMT